MTQLPENDELPDNDPLKPVADRIAAKLKFAAAHDRHGLMPTQIEAVKASAHHLASPMGADIVLPEGQPVPPQYLPEKIMHHHEIVSATGTGKTRILGALMDGSGERTLILTPRLNLNDQAKKELSQEMDIPESDIGIYDSDQSKALQKAALSKRCVISTYQSLPNLVEDSQAGGKQFIKELGERPLVLLDEAHTAQGDARRKILDGLKDKSVIIGVTATDAGVGETLFGGQSPVINLNLVTAVEQGLLAHGVRFGGTIDIKINEDWVQRMAENSKNAEFRKEDIERFAENEAAQTALAKFHLNTTDSQLGKLDRFKTLVFTQGVKAAKRGAEIFNEQAIAMGSSARAGWISGAMEEEGKKKTPKQIREEKKKILEDFKSGKISVLYNDRMLEMGYDLPEATIVYSTKVTNMPHVAEQQLGRVTRRQKEDYFGKYNMDKVALAINIRPKGVDSYTYGHVIGSKPAIYSKTSHFARENTKPFMSGMPHMEGVSYQMDYTAVEAMLHSSRHNESDLPPPPDNFLSKMDAYHSLPAGSSYKDFQNVWLQLMTKMLNQTEMKDNRVKIEFEGKPVTLGQFRRPKTQPGWYIDKASMPAISEYLQKINPKLPEDYYSRTAVAKAVNASPTDPFLRDFLDGLEHLAIKGGVQEKKEVTITYKDKPLRMHYGRVSPYRDGVGFHKDDIIPIVQEFQAERAKIGDKGNIRRKLGTSLLLNTIWNGLKEGIPDNQHHAYNSGKMVEMPLGDGKVKIHKDPLTGEMAIHPDSQLYFMQYVQAQIDEAKRKQQEESEERDRQDRIRGLKEAEQRIAARARKGKPAVQPSGTLSWVTAVGKDAAPVPPAAEAEATETTPARKAPPIPFACRGKDSAIRIIASNEQDPAYKDPQKTRSTFAQDAALIEELEIKQKEILELAKMHGIKSVDFSPYRAGPVDPAIPAGTRLVNCHYTQHEGDARDLGVLKKGFAEDVKSATGIELRLRPATKENLKWVARVKLNGQIPGGPGAA